jgi:Fe-S cluster biogenesis protein NfuA
LVNNGIFHDYTDVSQTDASPLAHLLFDNFSWVKEVFISSNYITLTKQQDVEWIEVQSPAREIISQELTNGIEIGISKAGIGNEELEEVSTLPPVKEEDQDTVTKIKEVLDEYIRPAVEQDGGAISFHSFNEGVVKVLLQGSCSGCPSSTITLKSGIETLLKRALPEVEMVEAIDA